MVQRYALKLSILAARLKPNICSIEPNTRFKLDSLRGLDLPKRLENRFSRFRMPYGTFNIQCFAFLVWATLVSLTMFIHSIRHLLAIIIF